MKAPRPILDGGGTDLEREVLRSGLDEKPPHRLLERTLTTVGVTAGLVTATATTTGAASAAVAGAKVGAMSTAWFVVKCIGIGLGAAAVGAGAVRVVTPADAPMQATHGVEQVVAASAKAEAVGLASERRAAEAQAHAVAEANTEAAAGAEAAGGGSVAAPQARAAGAEAAAGASTPHADANRVGGTATTPATPEGRAGVLAAETAILDAARRAFNAGDASRALLLLDQHATEYPGGVLAQEAEILRIHALFASGDRAAAADHARRFLARNPASPHAERLRRIAEGSAR